MLNGKRVVLFVSHMIGGSHQPDFFHKRQSLFCFGFRRNPPSDALLITHYCTLVGDSCRDSGRVLAKRIKDTSMSSMARYGTF